MRCSESGGGDRWQQWRQSTSVGRTPGPWGVGGPRKTSRKRWGLSPGEEGSLYWEHEGHVSPNPARSPRHELYEAGPFIALQSIVASKIRIIGKIFQELRTEWGVWECIFGNKAESLMTICSVILGVNIKICQSRVKIETDKGRLVLGILMTVTIYWLLSAWGSAKLLTGISSFDSQKL